MTTLTQSWITSANPATGKMDTPSTGPMGLVVDVATGNVYLNNGISYIGIGPTNTITLSSIISKLVTIKPKVASFGNSIAGLSAVNANSAPLLPSTTNPFWQANGYITALHLLSQGGFDRCRTNPINLGINTGSSASETLDHLGNYAYSGAILAQNTNNSMLSRKQAMLDQFIDTPDIVLLHNELENDIANWGGTYALGYSTITQAILRDIELFKAKWPNALIVYSCPNPSFFYLPDPSVVYAGWTTANGNNRLSSRTVTVSNGTNLVIYTNQMLYQDICTFIGTLPNLYSNLITEPNISRLDPTNVGIPLPGYLTYVGAGQPDGIHPNFIGELLRAQTFLKLYPWLFRNATIVPKLGYQAGQPISQQKSFAQNPGFVGTGSGGGTANNVTKDQAYTPWTLSGANVNATANQNASGTGIDVVITGLNGTYAYHSSGFSVNCGGTTTPLDVNTTYQGVAEITITNSANILIAEMQAQLSVTSNKARANQPETQIGFYNPAGWSNMLPAGQKLTLVTPPFQPGATDTSFAYLNLIVYVSPGLPTNPTPAQMPSFTINSFNVVQVDDVLPKVLTIPNAVALAFASGGAANAQSMTVASAAGVAAGQLLLSNTPVLGPNAAGAGNFGGGLQCITIVTGVATNTISFEAPLVAQAAGAYVAYSPYINRSKTSQQLSITGSAVSPVYYVISGYQIQALPAVNQTVELPPGAMFLASWVSGTPVFSISINN